MQKMQRLFAVAISWMVLVLVVSCRVAITGQPPLVSPLAKDPTTSLYTISIKDDGNGKSSPSPSPLVVDLAGSLVWSTCPSSSTHATVPCQTNTCSAANEQSPPPSCRYVDCGREPRRRRCDCKARPFNPVSGECSTGDLTSFAMAANATNGTSMLNREEFAVVGACAPERLLAALPAGAAGVAGLSRRPLSLPSQLAAQRGFGGKFALCLPAFAAFGDTPVYLPVPDPRGSIDYTTVIPYTPLLTNPINAGAGGYYIPVTGISVSWHGPQPIPASLPGGALELDARTGRGGVVLSTATPYTIMRPEVFRPFVEAFDAVVVRDRMSAVERVAGVPPFELCYGGAGSFPMMKRAGYDAPGITLELAAGAARNWTVRNGNYLVQTETAMCVGVVEMGPGGMPVDGEPAVVIGGMQLENNLLVFDLEKQVLGFSMLLDWDLTSCHSSSLIHP